MSCRKLPLKASQNAAGRRAWAGSRLCTGGHTWVASACPKMGHTFHLWKQLAPDGVIPGVQHSPPTDDGERGGGIWTADGSDPWVLCTSFQARRSRGRRSPVRLPGGGATRSAEPAALDVPGCPVRTSGLFAGPRCYPDKRNPSAVTTPSKSCACAALSGRERDCFRLRGHAADQGSCEGDGSAGNVRRRRFSLGAAGAHGSDHARLRPCDRPGLRPGPRSRRRDRQPPLRGNHRRRGMGFSGCRNVGSGECGFHALDRPAGSAERGA